MQGLMILKIHVCLESSFFSLCRFPVGFQLVVTALPANCTACAMLAEDEDQLGWEHLGDDIVQALQTVAAPVFTKLAGLANPRPVPAAEVLSLQELSSAAIDQALQSARGNVSKAARQLGISRQTLYRKLAARVH